MKKWIVTLLTFGMMLSMAACGNGTDADSSATSKDDTQNEAVQDENVQDDASQEAEEKANAAEVQNGVYTGSVSYAEGEFSMN